MRIELCEIKEVRAKKMVRKAVGGQEFLLVDFDDEIGVLAANCPHRGAPLIDGDLVEGMVICPWHRSVFRVRDGRCMHGPSKVLLKTYEPIIREDKIFIEI